MAQSIRFETLRHSEAFDYYYAMGPNRSYSAVADKFGISGVSVMKWARSFDWTNRVRERDKQNATVLNAITDSAVIDQHEKILKVVDKLIDQCATTDSNGNIVPKIHCSSVQDFERVVKLFLLLKGEPTDRIENANVDAREIINARIDRLMAAANQNRN